MTGWSAAGEADVKPQTVGGCVYQVGGPRITEPRDCCVYLIDGEEGLCLIDTGFGPSFNRVCFNIITLGFEPERIKTIVLTHRHINHVGAAAAFKKRFGSRLVAHAEDCGALEAGDLIQTLAFLYGKGFQPLSIDRVVRGDGERIAVGNLELYLLSTPCHTPGTISAVLESEGKRIIFGHLHGPFHPHLGGDRRLMHTSATRLQGFKADILCEGRYGVYQPACAVEWYIGGRTKRFE